jgi:hypothetical protein
MARKGKKGGGGKLNVKYLSHFDPGVLLERIHFAFAVEHCAHAAPHLAVGCLDLSELDIIIDHRSAVLEKRRASGSPRKRTSPADF